MADTDVSLFDSSVTNNYDFRAVSNWNVNKGQPAISIPLIGLSAGNNYLFRFTGQTEEISFDFLIFDDGVDTSDGSPGDIKTVDQQIAFLKNTLYTSGYSDYWYILQDRYYSSATTCIITNLVIKSNAGAPSFAVGSITLMLGRVASL